MIDFKKHLLGTTIVMGLAVMGAPAWAQTTSKADGDSATQSADTVEEVVVVGSRLRRDNYNSSSPVQVVTREDAILAGFASTTEVLQGTAITGGTAQINNAYGGYVTNGGPGANTLSLRGLGATRTLVLLNGRRVAPAGSRGSVGSADLNVLPSAMIERAEVLKDGASSIYGSDAVAGVVNIITRNDMDGVTIEGQYNASGDANGAGDSSRISIAGGATGDRWRFSASAERYVREELTLADRGFTQCNTDNYFGGEGDFINSMTGKPKCYPITDTGSNGVTINTIGTGLTYIYGNSAYAKGAGASDEMYYANRWRPNATVSSGLVGFEAVGGYDLNAAGTALTASNLNIRDTFEADMLKESLISPVEVSTGYMQGSYDLHALGNAEIYGEVLINRRDSSQTEYKQLSLDYMKGSALIPTSLAWSTFASSDQGISNGSAVGVRAFIGFGNTESTQTVDFAKTVGGIRGDLFLSDWRYDVSASYTRSKSEYTSQQFLTSLLKASLDVVAAPSGTDSSLVRDGYTCRVNTTDATAGCIPAPFLNAATISGDLPADWVNYVLRDVTGTTEYIEKVISAGIDGPLFTLPAGQVRAFLGAEWRDASIDDTPGEDMQNGNLWNYSTATITRGSESVWETFGEIEVPLLADLPFAQSLTFSGSARYTSYERSGSDWTYKAGLVYTPVDFLSFRGSYGTSFRAPALFEQFLGATSGYYSSSYDPCNDYTASGVNVNRAANCAAEGLPSTYTATSSVGVYVLGGADNDLKPETSTNLTVGFVLQPKLPDGWGDLSFATDYYEIEIDNGISRLGVSNILTQCYNSSTSDFASDSGYCSLVTRNASTNALSVYDSYVNVATDVVKGLDYTLRYRKDVGSGVALFNLNVTQMTELYSQLLSDDPIRDEVGTINSPEFSATADLTYSWDRWKVRYGVEWIKGTESYTYYQKYYDYDAAADGYDLEVSDYWLNNASVQYAGDGWTMTAGVRNLMNVDPPTISSGFYNRVGNAPLYSGYDYLGRSFFVNVSKSF